MPHYHHQHHGGRKLLVIAFLSFILGSIFGYKMRRSIESFNQWRYKKLKEMTDKAEKKLKESK
eukprot:m.245897 g.245897  ORF g.245897 m.245897 type:complete len:63 (+) comp66280_c0_seq1:41-229(+)